VAEIKKLVDRELGYIVEGSLSSHSKVGTYCYCNDDVCYIAELLLTLYDSNKIN